MEQLMFGCNFDGSCNIVSEKENSSNMIKNAINIDLKNGILENKLCRTKIIDWFCDNFFSVNIEMTCSELFVIANQTGIEIL